VEAKNLLAGGCKALLKDERGNLMGRRGESIKR
jgi:hypothetical protein